MGVANERSRRFGFDKESVFETTVEGAFVNPSAQKNVMVNPDREMVEREEHLNSFGDLYPADPGVQLFDATVEFDFCKQTYGDLKRLFSGALGQEDAAGTSLTYVNEGSTQSLLKVSSGTPQKIIKVTGDDGKVYLVPVKSFTGGTDINLDMQLPAAAIGAGLTIENPSEVGGGVFSYLLGTSADSFMLEFDRAGQSGQIKYRAWGAAIKAAVFMFELRRRLSVQFGFTASRWEKNPESPAMQLADAPVRTNPFMSFACNAHLYQATAAAAESNRTKLKQLAFSFAPALIEETGTKGLDGSGNTPGSDITGYTRAENWQERLRLTLTYPDAAWHDRLDPSNPDNYYRLFTEFYSAKPSAAPSSTVRLAVWFTYLHQNAEPKLTVVNSGEAQELSMNIGRDPSTSLAAMYVAMVNT